MNDIFKKLLGEDKLACVDVGARGGMPQAWRPFVSILSVDAFEPDPEACQTQKAKARPGENWYPIALGRTTGTSPLYVLQKASSSSLYPPNPAVMNAFAHGRVGEVKKIVNVDLMSFSDFIDRFSRPLPSLIKLDVQGAELDVMASLRDEHWASLLAVQCEVEFIDYYIGQPLFHEVDAFMRSRGFLLFDLLPERLYRVSEGRERHYLRKYLGIARNRNDISRRLVAGDAFYIRPPETIAEVGSRNEVIKLLAILIMYRFLDEALWLIETIAPRGTLTASEANDALKLVKSLAPRPSLLQRSGRVGKWARWLAKRTGIGRSRKLEFWLDRSWDW